MTTQTGVVSWSQTAASNASADSNVNWPEGQAPSSVNDSARAEMASVAKYRDDTAGSLTTGGTSTAYTLTTNQVFSSLTVLNGQELSVKFNATNGASPTLNVDGLGAKAINVDTATAVGTGVIKANSVWNLVYDNSNSCFLLKAVPAQVQDGTVATASIAANAVTLAKMATQADGTVLGNISGGAAVPSALTISGAALSGSTITVPHPPRGAFSNLAIKVASTTTVTVTADYVTMFDGTSSWQTNAVSSTINLGTTGADALDTGTIASATWYAIWAIAKTDGTTKCIASTSATAPTMPSGYTFKARIGWVRTASGVAQLLGTYQYGRVAQYIVGLGALSTSVTAGTGVTSGYSRTAPTWTSVAIGSFIPSTAFRGHFKLVAQYNGSGGTSYLLAANSSYAGMESTSPPFGSQGMSSAAGVINSIWMVLESTNVYAAANASGGAFIIEGWEDNI